MPYLGDSDSNLENYCHIWNQGPGICLIAKFGAEKKKILEFVNKNI